MKQLKLRTKIYRLNLPFETISKPGHMLEISVVAYNEKHARFMAGYSAGKEGQEIWGDRHATTCTEVGNPNHTFRHPQVLIRYVQTPYKDTEYDS